MSTSFRLKTQPELLLRMMSNLRAVGEDDGIPVDLNPGSTYRTMLEVNAESQADGYIQIAKLLKLFGIFTAKGDDLDERMRDLGADLFPEMRRLKANSSIGSIVVGDGTQILNTAFAADVLVGATSFSIPAGVGASFPVSGSFVLEQGTPRQETIVFKRTVDTITVLYPTNGVQNAHPVGGVVTLDAMRSYLTVQLNAGGTSIGLPAATGAGWATSGFVVIDQGTVVEEKLAFTRSGDTLTIAPAAFTHLANALIVQSTFGSDRNVAQGLSCYVPATESTKQVDYRVIDTDAKLLDGAFLSDLIDVESVAVGLDTLVGANTIIKWSTEPFASATVMNPTPTTRGRNREEDKAYVIRVVNFIQSLSRGTPLAITTLVSGELDPETNRSVVFAQIVEPVAPGMSILYISDGSEGFALNQVPFIGRDVIISDAEAGDRRGRLHNYGPFGYSTSPATPRLFKSIERGTATAVGVNSLTDNTKAMVVNAHTGHYLKADDDKFYPIASNTATVFTLSGGATPSLGSYSVYDFGGVPLVPGTDFVFNQTNGDIELSASNALLARDGLVAASDGASPSVGAYTYTIGLGAFVQRLVNGDYADVVNFPGLRATGSQILVTAPTTVSRPFAIQVLPLPGFTDVDLRDSVANAVITYVNSLGIGENVIISEIIKLVKLLPGVYDVRMVSPTANVTIVQGSQIRIGTDDVEVV